MAKNLVYLIYDITHKEPESQSQNKNFFSIAELETCQVFWGFEQL